MARPYFWKYVEDQPAFPGMPGVSGAQSLMFMAGGWNEELKTPQWKDLYNQVSSGKEYDKNLYEQLVAPHTYDYWYNNGGNKDVEKWHQADLAEQKRKQEEALAKQKAEQERIRKEQQAALERQRQEVAAADEKARKESEFKSALEAMNQRAMPRKGTEEYIGAVEEDPQDSAKKKKRRVGYDATKSTGVLGIPQTERKQLLGM